MSTVFENFLASACYLFGPIIVFGIYKLRRHSRTIQQSERYALPYEPKTGPAPVFFLRRFSAPEQTYLQQLLDTALYLFLTAIHGPIWRHLPAAVPGMVTLLDGTPQLYAALLATSPPHVFLSLCTTTALSLGFFAVLLAIP